MAKKMVSVTLSTEQWFRLKEAARKAGFLEMKLAYETADALEAALADDAEPSEKCRSCQRWFPYGSLDDSLYCLPCAHDEAQRRIHATRQIASR